jgi:hypothetical protein
MDWITLGALALIAAVAIFVARRSSRGRRPSNPGDPEDRDALQLEQDDTRRRTSWEGSGL